MMSRLLELLRDTQVIDSPGAARTRIWWSHPALTRFVRDAEYWGYRETGAALLGYENDGQLVVVDVVLGGPRSRHGRSFFVPDSQWQIDEIRRRYHESGRLARYLGEIHTHPYGECALSRRDRRTVRRIARHRLARLARPLMSLMVGGDGMWRLATWEYADGILRPCENMSVPIEVGPGRNSARRHESMR